MRRPHRSSLPYLAGCSALATLLVLASVSLAQEAATGVVAGKVLDASTGEPLIDAGVEVVSTKQQTRTDVDGRYTFKLPPGTYDLRFFASGYQSARVTGVEVGAGKVEPSNVTLAPLAAGAGVEVVEVVAKANRAAEAAQILERRSADVIEDTISAEVISKSTDSDAAEIVERVPAVTVRDDKYVYVRGLGERYSSALLNGSRLPSPDPNKRVVPLDLFPSQFIDSIAIIKSYSPDLPGDFSGGLVDINLKTFPETLVAKLGLSLGANTNSSFQSFQDFDGSGNVLGLAADNGLPSIFGNKTIGAPTPASKAGQFASKLPNVWSPFETTAPPNFSLNASVGNSWGPLGMTLGANWTNSYKVEKERIERQFVNGGEAEPILLVDDFLYDYNVADSNIGTVYTAGYDIDPDNRVNFRALYTRNAENRVELGTGTTSQNPEQINNITRLEYGVEDLIFGQLQGVDHTDWFDVDWRSAFARSTQNLPDTRTTDYLSNPSDPTAPPTFSPASLGGTRVFFDITEYMSDSAFDVTVPFKTWLPFTDVWRDLPASFKFGPAYTHRERTTDLRQFRYLPRGAQDLSEPPDQLIAPDRVSQGLVSFEETTQLRDSFFATEDIAGMYGMFDFTIVKDLVKLVAGVRTEYSYIHLITHDDAGTRVENNINNLDPLPAVNVIVTPRDDMSVRAGWSETVSRPEFRELSPVFYPEPRGLRPTIGNPFLVEAHIDNVDLRWDWFYSPLELFSVSLFYKQFDKPIEEVVLAQSSNPANSFANAKSADLKGFEVEARKNFEFVADPLRYLTFNGNFALIDSNVKSAPPGQFQVQTSNNRPLQGQAPFVINAMLDYSPPDFGSVRLLYNTAGRSIEALGAFGLPDIYREVRNEIDLVYIKEDVHIFDVPLDFKFSAENLLNQRFLSTQGGKTQEKYFTGITFSVGFTYNF